MVLSALALAVLALIQFDWMLCNATVCILSGADNMLALLQSQ